VASATCPVTVTSSRYQRRRSPASRRSRPARAAGNRAGVPLTRGAGLAVTASQRCRAGLVFRSRFSLHRNAMTSACSRWSLYPTEQTEHGQSLRRCRGFIRAIRSRRAAQRPERGAICGCIDFSIAGRIRRYLFYTRNLSGDYTSEGTLRLRGDCAAPRSRLGNPFVRLCSGQR